MMLAKGFLLRSVLRAVIAQRLVRTLCPHCKKETDISDEDWASLVAPWKAHKPRKVYEAVGCLECRNTGYRGRIGIYELLRLDDSMRTVIRTSGNIEQVQKKTLRLHNECMIWGGLFRNALRIYDQLTD